jgi:acyl-CoA synthetase (AMP-forming)/AMP-acid ligase II
MTTATITPSTDMAGRIRQRAAVLTAVSGPLAIAALRGLLPYDTIDNNATVVEEVVAHPVAETAVLWLSWLALLTLPLAVLVVSGVAMRARPLLGTIAAVIAWLGFADLAFLITPDQAALGGVDAGLPTATTAALMSAVDQNPVTSTATALFVSGHIIGTAYHTGDLASMNAMGFVRIEGRVKDMIIRGGENIYPREIEDVLFAHPDVAEAAIVGAPDTYWGETVAAFVRLQPGATTTAADLHEHCRERLAPYKTPQRWQFVDEFPLTPSGKIQKFKLREALATQPPGTA